jgi:hypothetical protein
MKFMRKTTAFVFAGASFAAAVYAAAATEATTSRIWTSDSLKNGNFNLSYATPDSDDVGVVMTCAPGQGTVNVFLSETSDKFKAGEKATAVLSAGPARLSFPVTFEPNEEAGVPSAEGDAPLNHPFFSQLKGAGKLTIAINGWTGSFPLKGVDEEAAKFIPACSKQE